MFNVVISIEDSKVLGGFKIDSYFFEPAKYDYAFYLYKNGERIDTVWYTKNMEVIFYIGKDIGVFQIKAYIRDIQNRDKRSFYSEKISIDS